MTGRFDLSAYREQANASAAEAQDETFTVYLGQSKDDEGNLVDDVVEIPPLRRWPIEAQKVLSEGDLVEGLTMLVGPEDADKFASYTWSFAEFEALFNALSEWQGFRMGRNSSPRQGRVSTRP